MIGFGSASLPLQVAPVGVCKACLVGQRCVGRAAIPSVRLAVCREELGVRDHP